jgi:hypothetical protein
MITNGLSLLLRQKKGPHRRTNAVLLNDFDARLEGSAQELLTGAYDGPRPAAAGSWFLVASDTPNLSEVSITKRAQV